MSVRHEDAKRRQKQRQDMRKDISVPKELHGTYKPRACRVPRREMRVEKKAIAKRTRNTRVQCDFLDMGKGGGAVVFAVKQHYRIARI